MSKVVLITGARKGIGLAMCNHYLSKGYYVCGCSRKESDLEHENYHHYKVDVSHETEIIKMVRNIKKTHKRIDVLINNAGKASMNHLSLTSISTVDSIFDTNFKGTFLLTREVSKLMVRKRYGRIVNLSSIAVPLNLEGEAAYASSKAAIECFTKISAKELSPFNITVNVIGPTPIETDLIKNVPGKKINSLIENQGIKRMGKVSDVLNVVDFFISDQSDFITGQTIYLGGVV